MSGILAVPADGSRVGGKPGIIILNTGIAHRVGHFRVTVELARRLAANGHAVLRFDFSGIGESERRDDGSMPLDSTKRDIAEAADFLRAKCGLERLILVGNCSGADIALVYAGSDPRVVGTVLIDPTIPVTPRYHQMFLYQRLYSWRSWLNLVLNPQRLWDAVRGIFVPTGSRTPADPNLSNPEIHNFLQSCFASIVAADVKIMFVHTGGISYRYNYENQLVDAFPEVDFSGKLSIFNLPECDHLFAGRRDRQQLGGLIEGWLASTEFRDGPARPDDATDHEEYF